VKLTEENCAIITVIENNGNLENEAELCFKYLRENNGVLSNIPIYTICITKKTISNKMKTVLEKYKVIYIEEFDLNSQILKGSGFFNMPLGCAKLEEKLDYEYLIYLDLDMFLINPMKLNYNTDLIIEEYNFNNGPFVWEKSKNEFSNLFNTPNTYINTQFIITKRENYIFKQWKKNLLSLYKPKNYIGMDISVLEEFSFEILIHNMNKKNYTIVKDIVYRLGDPVCIPESLENIFFLSTHNLTNFKKTMKEIKCLILKTTMIL